MEQTHYTAVQDIIAYIRDAHIRHTNLTDKYEAHANYLEQREAGSIEISDAWEQFTINNCIRVVLADILEFAGETVNEGGARPPF